MSFKLFVVGSLLFIAIIHLKGCVIFGLIKMSTILMILLVGMGGFIGAVFRYLVSLWVQSGSLFPAGTLAVNFIGSFFLSVVMYFSEYRNLVSEEVRLFLAVGLLGAFTTMSTFSVESFKLFEQKEFLLFGLNVFGTLILTFVAVYLGRVVVFGKF